MSAAQVAAGGATDPATGNPLQAADPANPQGLHQDAQGNTVNSGGQIVRPASGITGEGFGGTLGTLVNVADKDNPLAGTIHAGEDIANGQYGKAGGDFAQGATYGTLPVGGDSVPDATKAVGKLPGVASSAAGNLVNGIGGALAGAPDPSTDQLSQLTQGAAGYGNELDTERQKLAANPTAAPQTGLVQLDQTNIDPLRQRQGVALDALAAAANGTAPSAAEILGKAAADRASAQAYGTAAALQGGNSTGGTLRQALDAGAQLQGDALTKMIADRAAEQASARQQLVQGIQNATNEEGTLSTTDAGLKQQGNLANQASDITTHGQDITQEGNLISGTNTAQGNAITGGKATLDAQVQEQANKNALKGAEIGAGGAVLGKIISDEREKTGIRRADLVQLADDSPGYTFDYRDPANGPGRRVGVMAQDVARARLGKRLVQLGDDGDLELDGANAIGAALAMSAQALREAHAARGR